MVSSTHFPKVIHNILTIPLLSDHTAFSNRYVIHECGQSPRACYERLSLLARLTCRHDCDCRGKFLQDWYFCWIIRDGKLDHMSYKAEITKALRAGVRKFKITAEDT